VISFALKISLWNLKRGKKNNTLIFDEPFKFYNYEQEKVGELKKELSRKLGLQFIFVTHNPVYAKDSDSVFEVVQINGVSKVERIENA
jgi:ABC-type lipoprotein export system ATPase subunit